jgi:flagellin-like protein
MKKLITTQGVFTTIILIAFILMLSGCANSEVVTGCLKGHTYGFWGGLWHGIIAPIDLIAMLWRDDVSVFAQNNNGIWYAFGFILGSGGWGFLGGHRASRSLGKK